MEFKRIDPADVPSAVELARTLGLDYPGMEADALWVASESGAVVGLVALRRHPDCLELCALGVEPARRGKGIAKALVEALMAEAPGEVHLATVIPGFFASCGFGPAAVVPPTFPARRGTAWCEGCRKELCTVMVRPAP